MSDAVRLRFNDNVSLDTRLIRGPEWLDANGRHECSRS
jgi:hypothetical protein